MKSLRDQGHANLLVERNFALAMAVADRVHVVSSGRFVFDGTPAELARATEILDHYLGVAAAGQGLGPGRLTIRHRPFRRRLLAPPA